MADLPLLTIQKLQRSVNSHTLWSNISFEVFPGEIWFLRGPSGIGKTLLLRAVACLDPLEAGLLRLAGRTPSETGMTCWRAQVMYVHQSRVNFKGSPADTFTMVAAFASQAGRPRGDLAALVVALGLEAAVLQQQWAELSGGQAQRVSLAIAIALQPKVLLLDEPTSACDQDAALRVEAVLKRCSAAILWVTHDPQQPLRVGGKVLELPSGSITTVSPEVSPEVTTVSPEVSPEDPSEQQSTVSPDTQPGGGGLHAAGGSSRQQQGSSVDGKSGSSSSSSSSRVGVAAAAGAEGETSLVA